MIKGLFYNFCLYFCLLFFKIFFRFKAYKKAVVPKKGPIVIGCNHVSHLDPIAVGLLVKRRDLFFLAKEELFKNRLFARFLKALNVVPIRRDAKDFEAINSALDILKNGGCLAIFPEGTRSIGGSLKGPKSGIGLIAYRSRAPIFPIYINGSNLALPKGALFFRLKKIKAFIGNRVDFYIKEDVKNPKDYYQLIAKEVMDRIAELKEGF